MSGETAKTACNSLQANTYIHMYAAKHKNKSKKKEKRVQNATRCGAKNHSTISCDAEEKLKKKLQDFHRLSCFPQHYTKQQQQNTCRASVLLNLNCISKKTGSKKIHFNEYRCCMTTSANSLTYTRTNVCICVCIELIKKLPYKARSCSAVENENLFSPSDRMSYGLEPDLTCLPIEALARHYKNWRLCL